MKKYALALLSTVAAMAVSSPAMAKWHQGYVVEHYALMNVWAVADNGPVKASVLPMRIGAWAQAGPANIVAAASEAAARQRVRLAKFMSCLHVSV